MSSQPLLPQQERFRELALDPQTIPAAHIALAFELKGELDTEKLKIAFSQTWDACDLATFRFDLAAGKQWQEGPVPLTYFENDVREAEVKAIVTQDFNRAFNLLVDCPLRVRLLHPKPGKYVLGIVAHHIALDGWSIARFLEKACDAYNALVAGETLPKLPWQSYKKYQVEFNQQLAKAESERSLDFWRNRSFTSPPLLANYQAITRGHRVIYILNKKFYQRVKDLAKAHRVTPFLFLLHAFSGALSKVLGKNDLLLSVPIASRDWDLAEYVVGNCVNLMPLDIHLSGELTNDLQKIRASYLEAISHSLIPIERIQAFYQVDLTQVHFNFEPSIDEPKLAGLEIDFFPYPINQVEKPIIINVNDTKKTYYIEIDYQAQALDLMKSLSIFTETERVINRMWADHTRVP